MNGNDVFDESFTMYMQWLFVLFFSCCIPCWNPSCLDVMREKYISQIGYKSNEFSLDYHQICQKTLEGALKKDPKLHLYENVNSSGG